MSSQLQVSGEAKIRDIQGPVVANSGVITALDGAASQYVRGDGTLADFPTSTGGGSSVSYYLNSSVSQGTIGGVAYRELSKEPIIGAGTDIAISTTGYVASYLTDANDPDVLSIPGGNFNCEFYFSVNNNTGNAFFYAELYKYDGTTFTLIGSSVGVPEYINQGTIINPYYFAIPVPTTPLALTDRLAIRIYVNVDGRTVTLHTENGHLCQVVTTLSKGMVSLNNLTDQSQNLTTGTSGTNFAIVSSGDTHTFNLPIASATNTGKLSSTDWSTFNNKQAALSFTAPLNNTSNTISIPAATSLVDGYLDNLDWVKFDTAYNRSLTSAAVTGTTTKTLTLNKQDGGTITASWTDDNTDAVTSVFGRTGAVVATSGDYNTSQVTELTNLYFTDARSRAALSFTAGSGAYNSTTGVITIPTNTNQLTNGASFITLASLSGGTGITYNNTTGVITNSAPDQTVSLTQGAGISISGTYPSFTIASTITQYTDALARAALSFTAGSGAYNSTTGVITIPTNNNQITNGSNFITLTSLSAGAGINYNNTTGAISSTITQYTDALARAAISLTTTGTSGAATYNSTTGVFNIPQYTDQYVGTVTSVGLSSSTSGVTIGSTPITTSGTITLAIATASGSQNGLLSSTDWTTFNNKYNLPSLTSGSVLFSNGSTIAQDNANFFWDDTNNRLGIGTATPIYTLDVVKTGSNGIRVLNNDTGSDAAFVIVQNLTTAGLFGVNNAGPYLYTASALDMQFYTSAIERMRIFSDGNILIGSSLTNAGYKLDVSGTGRFTGDVTVGASSQLYLTSGDLRYSSNAGFGIVSQNGNRLVSIQNDAFGVNGAATFSSSIAANGVMSLGNDGTYGSTYKTLGLTGNSNGSHRIFAGTADDMYIAAATGRGIQFWTNGNVGGGFTIASGGAATFSSSVTASGDITSRTSLNVSTLSNVEPYIFLARNSGSNGIGVIRTLDGGALAFDNGATGAAQSTKMTLDASGNLGLGVTPSQSSVGINKILDIGGATVPGIVLHSTSNTSEMAIGTGGDGLIISASGSANAANDNVIRFFTAAANSSFAISEKMRLFSDGNLLLTTSGTLTNAGYKLDVNGTGRFSGALTVNGTRPILTDGSGGNIFIQGESGGWAVQYGFRGNAGTNRGGFGALGGTNDLSYWFIGKAYNDNALSLDYSTGAATFSSTGTFGGRVQSTGGGNGTNDGGFKINYFSNANSRSFLVLNDVSAYGDFGLYQSTTQTGTTYSSLLYFTLAGAATFSSSVTATSFFESSDSRLKILVKDYEQPKGIENVAARMYVKNSKKELGYFAQDLQEILPSAVSEGSDGFLSLSYSQVHTAKIAYLEKEVAELKELIKSLI